jgi:hypothetical protein
MRRFSLPEDSDQAPGRRAVLLQVRNAAGFGNLGANE